MTSSTAASRSRSSPRKGAENHHPAVRRREGLCGHCLYFSILKVRPTPFVVMDEIEAALDDANVVRFAQYPAPVSDKTQFIVITHRRAR